MKSNLKIAITGASGFIGQHLLEDIDFTKYSVSALTRNLDKKMRVSPSACEIVKADLRDYESLNSAFKGVDVIINIAAEVRNDKMFADTNIAGTQNLINAAISNNVAKIIHISSVGVVGIHYSPTHIVFDEQAVCTPSNEYERTKLESERLLIEGSKRYKFKLDIIRPTNVFGEFHLFNALLNLMNHVNSGQIILGAKTAKVNYIYVKDLTALIIQLIDLDDERAILNIGSHEEFQQFISLINFNLGKTANYYSVPQLIINLLYYFKIKKLNAVSNKVIYSDEKLKSFFKYPYGLQKGLQNTISHYKKYNLIK